MQVIVYADEGVDGGALKQLIRSLQQEIDLDRCSLVRMDAKKILEEPWEKSTILLIVPGGRDVFYHASLDGKGTEKIHSFVENGGSYFGICAGAYFGCSAIEFEKGGLLEVCADRSLKFFPGVAKGSAFGPNKYSYENARGAEAAKISSEAGDCHVYFNGGCFFDAQDHYPAVNILSHYVDIPGRPPAVVHIQRGRGQALLSGVHIEYAPRLLNRDDPYLARIIPQLEEAEARRRVLFRSYLKLCGVPISKKE